MRAFRRVIKPRNAFETDQKPFDRVEAAAVVPPLPVAFYALGRLG